MSASLRCAIVLALATLATGPALATATLPVPAPIAVPMPPLPPELVPPPVDPAIAAPIEPPRPALSGAALSTPALSSGRDLFARLDRNLGAGDCNAGSNSARWRQRYAGNPAAFSRRLQSVLPLLDFVSVEVERAGLPAEFTFIPLVESWYQPGAMGAGGPAGMWQMIGSTARNHGIHIRDGYDGRLSPVESTRAALSYLKTLQKMFGDWQAIVMAYNAGEGRMQRALQHAGSRVTSAAERRPHGLSNITYDYVAKLQALSCLVSQPLRFGVHLPLETRYEPLVPLLMDPGMDSLEEFARARGKDAAELRRLNPGFRGGRVVAGVPRLVLATPGAVVRATAAPETMVAAADPPPLELQFALAGLDESPADEAIAQVLDEALADPLPEELPPAAGEPAPAEVLPRAIEAASETAGLADGGTEVKVALDVVPVAESPAPEQPQVHEVRSGESLSSIAKHYQLPLEQLRRANGLDSKAVLHPGQRLRLLP